MNPILPPTHTISEDDTLNNGAILPWLEHLRTLFPIAHALVVGAGNGTSKWIRFLSGVSPQAVTMIEADEDSFHKLQRVTAKEASWTLIKQLITPLPGPAKFHRTSVPAENGMLHPSALRGLWPTISLQESIEKEGCILDAALDALPTAADWLFIDCLPAYSLLKGCNLRRSGIQVIVARVVRSPDGSNLTGASPESLIEALDQRGFQFLAYEHTRNPNAGHVLFVRKSRQHLNHPPPATLPELNERWLQSIRSLAVSQLGQDLWVLERCSYKRGGFFVEFGATDGISLSNTYLLEKEFGWNGICAEPNPKYFSELCKARICKVACECISGITGEQVEFVFASEYGGMKRDMYKDSHSDKRQPYIDTMQTDVLCTISLHDFLIKHNSPQTIDYLSIDTEGSEFSILETFPFDYWDVRNITVEHNYTEQRQDIRNLLFSHGYKVHEAEWDDWYYRDELSLLSDGLLNA